MYKRIYWSDPNRANASLLKHIFFIVNRKPFIDEVLSTFHFASKKDIQRAILSKADANNLSTVEASLNQLNQKGQTRYKSVLVLDKNSEYPHSNQICRLFSESNYSKQHDIRDKLEQALIDRYNIYHVGTNYGAIVLVDMPYENRGSKLGEDIRILRYDESHLPLTKASGIVSGLGTAFDDQLMLLRVFLRPDIYENLIDKFGDKDVAAFICDKLYEFL